MRQILVVYKSNYGYTKTYAELIAEELRCELREASGVCAELLMRYDTIIYGGGLYAAGINGIGLIRQNFDRLKEKELVVWATGSSPGRPEELQQVWELNFTDEMREQIHTFYLRGGFDYQRLSGVHKCMMRLLRWKLKHTKNRSEDQEGMLRAFDTAECHCDKRNIAGLTDFVRGCAER